MLVSNVMLWLTGSMATLLHPFFISMTDVNHNAKTKTLEVSVRIFTDDFEKALSKKCNCKLDLMKPVNKSEVENQIATYVTSHVSIKTDGKRQALQFVGYDEEDGSIWNYFEVKDIAPFTKLELFNNILHENSDQQVNMVHVKANGKDKTEKLDYPKNTLTVNW
jgi:ribosomal protein S17E